METLRANYGALLDLVEKLIGVIPNCDPYLEIWPPAFRSYNVMIPNFLNLPFSLWGTGAPKDVVGLAMYVASRTAGCAYCSAHTSAFALRRGARPEKVAGALEERNAALTPEERAAIVVARSMARIPANVTDAERQELLRHFSPGQAEWIVLGISMMGFLNKLMDAMGVELEASTIDEVCPIIGPSGWSPGQHGDGGRPRMDVAQPSPDGLRTHLGIVALIPAALSLDRLWTAGVPKKWPEVGDYLRRHTGNDFPVLSRLINLRAIRAIAVMVRDNLDPQTTTLGLTSKYLAGLVYGTLVEDAQLATEMRSLAAHAKVPASQIEAVVKFARGAEPPSGVDAGGRAALSLARAASPSPAVISAQVIDECRTSGLPAAAIVELITWISVLQMLHRLNAFYPSS